MKNAATKSTVKPPKASSAKTDAAPPTVATIMIKANKFNREIKIESENRDLENGTTVATRVIYFGFGQGYYVSQNGDIGGIGTSTDKGWLWVPRNDAAAGIAQTIGAKTNKEPAAFVKLPVLIDGKEVK